VKRSDDPLTTLQLASQVADPNVLYVVGAWYLVMGLYTFMSFARDKHAARRHRRRTSERHLHILELLGGFLGAWIAILVLRHKSRKLSFLVISVLTSGANFVGVSLLLYLLVFKSV
tara:strand:- start:522 stop:869 length:348 start_codon:yes stop_codon:yes gene_type:complete